MNNTVKELYRKYINKNPTLAVSYGTLLALEPFYVQSATTKDMEMCCCKKHLPAGWFINALISCCQKQNIDLEFHDYCSFFEFLTSEGKKEGNTYISWNCTLERSLLNCAPCVLKTCLRANVPYVLTYSHANVPHVLMCLACSCANVPCVLMCSYALHTRALCTYMLVCKRAILNNINLYIIQIC